MHLTASDLFDILAPHYGDGGICVNTEEDKQKILTELNNAIPMLMKRLDAKGTIWYWRIPVYGGIFALPFDCLEVRQAWLDGHALEQRDEWYMGKLGMDDCDAEIGCDGGQLIDLGDGYALPYRWPDIHFDARFAIMAEADADAGQEVHVRLRDRYGDTQQETLTIPANQQLVATEHAVTDITFFKKPITSGNIRRYIYYPQTNRRIPIDSLVPVIENVSYRKKQLPQGMYCNEGVLRIKGKRRFLKILSEYEPLPISDPEALGFAFRALAAMRRGENALYNENLTYALNELDKQLQDSKSRAAVSPMTFKGNMRAISGRRCWS